MKLKYKIIYLLLIPFIFVLTSCKKIIITDENSANVFLNEYYLYLSDQKQNFIGIDLRDLNDEYSLGHLKGFINYNYFTTRSKNESDAEYNQKISNNFQKWMRMKYDKSTTIFMIDNGINQCVIQEAGKLKAMGYKKIYIYTVGYDSLIKFNEGKIPVIIGTDDCGC